MQTAACRRTREGLTEYLENALSPERRQGLEQHLAGCAGCREEKVRLEAIIAGARSVAAERMPERMKRVLLRKFSGRSEADVEAGVEHG